MSSNYGKKPKPLLKTAWSIMLAFEHLDPHPLRIARKGIIAEENPSFTRRFSAGQICGRVKTEDSRVNVINTTILEIRGQ